MAMLFVKGDLLERKRINFKTSMPGDSIRDLFGMVKMWPFEGVVRDLQLGDEKVTLNHLV